MRNRLEVESEGLAAVFRAAGPDTQQRVAAQMVARALGAQQPPLELPDDPAAQQAVAAQLDSSDDEADFRRARAAAAAVWLREAAYEDALYEALHARADMSAAVHEAISLIP
jgi:hypothetical protein